MVAETPILPNLTSYRNTDLVRPHQKPYRGESVGFVLYVVLVEHDRVAVGIVPDHTNQRQGLHRTLVLQPFLALSSRNQPPQVVQQNR